jgi:4'-phosphopantetheinyl transferase EntD
MVVEWEDGFLGNDVLLSVRPLGDVVERMFPEEAALVVRAVDKRRREFAAGRVLARELMGQLGVPAAPLLRGEDRVPLWPAGVVGALSHTDEVVMVAVAGHDHGDAAHPVRALGLDVEPDVPLDEELRGLVLTPREASWLGEQPADERGSLAKLVFSAKEAVYKAQYAFSRTLLDFQEVELVLLPDVPAFEAHLPGKVVGAVGRETLAGHWWRGELCGTPCVVTGVVVREA